MRILNSLLFDFDKNTKGNGYRTSTLVCVLVAIWIGVFFDTFYQLVSTWLSSTTFEHAFFVFPIAIWLIIRKRTHFQTTNVGIHWVGAVLLGSAVGVYLVGQLSLINAIEQFAVMSMPLFVVWTIYGFNVVKRVLFPFVFLLLAVPFGEFLIPTLQEVTADLTVAMLQFAGVPVFREGWYLQIPEGLFHVAEACSGIRFLFSTITIGLLIAHLEIRSRMRQLIFMLVVCITPIIANGIRAFIMVYIGHVTSMKAAVGFDHIVYGWFFFLFVTILILMIGRLFSDNKPNPPLPEEGKPFVSPLKPYLVSGGIILLGPLFIMIYHAQQHHVDVRHASTLEQTESHSQRLVGWQPIFVNPDESMTNRYETKDGTIYTYAYTYYSESEHKELVTWENRIFDPEYWSIEKDTSLVLNLEGSDIAYRHLVLANGRGLKINVVTTYKVGEHYVTNTMLTKLYQLVGKLSLTELGGSALFAATSDGIPPSVLATEMIKQYQLKQREE